MITVEDIKKRLESFGYSAVPENEAALAFALKKASDICKNDCNVSEVPEGLETIVIDMAVGEFFLALKTFNPSSLSNIGLSFDSAVKELSEGDTRVSFATDGNKSDEQKLDIMIDLLINGRRSEFACYRRFRW